MNRIPVVNEDQRAGYGAPTTEVEAELLEAFGKAEAAQAPAKPEPKAKDTPKAPAKKKPAAKAKAKK